MKIVSEKGAANLARFAAAMPEESAWLVAKAPGFRFAADMLATVERLDRLTPNQLGAVQRLMKRDMDAAAAKVAAVQTAPAVSVAKIEAAFEVARSKGIKRPRLSLDGFQFKPASATGHNAGALYVTLGKGEDAPYLGKVLGGLFLASKACDAETRDRVVAAAADPFEAAKAYGQRTGACAVCGRPLTAAESVDLGIGPICAERMGWLAPKSGKVEQEELIDVD